ncbi:MAG: hypothetical protein WBE83_10555 [Candidatus Cybelea sp.]
MDFVLRRAVESDLDQCLALTTDRFLYDPEQLTMLRDMWCHIITTKDGIMAVLAEASHVSHVRFFFTAAFVSNESVGNYHRLSRPKIAHAMVEQFHRGAHPFLSRLETAHANAAGTVNVVLAHHGYEERHDESNEKTRAATYQLVRKYLSGWNLRTYTNEVFARDSNRDGKEMGEALGFRTRRYTEQQLRHAGIPPDRAPWVWTATRQDALSKPAGLGLALIFLSFSRPRFGFSFAEQDTLELALDGHTDEGIASAMNTSTATIKKRFRAIHEKVEDATLDELTALVREPAKVGVRGPESRRWILNYLRDHHEEMRPYSMPASNGAYILQNQ